MEISILSPLWGHEDLGIKKFVRKISDAGYDGLETWIPEDRSEQKALLEVVENQQMRLVTHQHAASGSTFKRFCRSFHKNLLACALPQPLLINSHTGRDFFSLAQHLDLIHIAMDVAEKTGIEVVHETHRGRMGYCPQMMEELFRMERNFSITADFSHWVCVTESMLQNFRPVLKEAIKRTRHIHARIGFEQGPQISDPRAQEWEYAVDIFLNWWDEIVAANQKKGTKSLCITTEFGPAPYMPSLPFSRAPVADQFAVNCYLKDLLNQRYGKSTWS